MGQGRLGLTFDQFLQLLREIMAQAGQYVRAVGHLEGAGWGCGRGVNPSHRDVSPSLQVELVAFENAISDENGVLLHPLPRVHRGPQHVGTSVSPGHALLPPGPAQGTQDANLIHAALPARSAAGLFRGLLWETAGMFSPLPGAELAAQEQLRALRDQY